MRTLLTGERATISGSTVLHFVKVQIADAGGTLQDYSDYVMDGTTWGEDVNTPVSQATVYFRRADGTNSLAPLMSASPLNVYTGSYAPAIDLGRQIVISTAVLASGSPSSGDWREMFNGRVDAIAWEQDPIQVSCSDQGAWLMDTQIEPGIPPAPANQQYGSDAGVAVETIIQQILNANPSGKGIPTLYVPTSPGWALHYFTQENTQVLTACQTLGIQCARDVRFRYDASHASRLTLTDPDRSRSSIDATIADTEYLDVAALSLNIADIRNAGAVPYGDSTGIVTTITNADVDTTTQATADASIAKVGRRYFALAQTIQIDTLAEAVTYLAAVLNDLSGPLAVQQVTCLYLWFVQLYDRYTFTANGVHYDQDQDLSVTSYSHTLQNGEIVTVLNCADRVVGAYADWLKRMGPVDTSTAGRDGLTEFTWVDSADGTQRTFSWKRGDQVATVWVYDALKASPPTTNPWPVQGTLPTATCPVGTDSYTVTKPKGGYQRFIQFEPRLGGAIASGAVMRVVVDPASAALGCAIHAAVTGATADLSVQVSAGAADWPVTVNVYETDPTGATLASTSVSANTTLTKTDLTALGGRALPLRSSLRWWVEVVNAAGQAAWNSCMADRDAIPGGVATVTDFQAAPSILVTYDDDTDEIQITLANSSTKTWTRSGGDLSTGGGTVTYTVGDAVDSGGTIESAFADNETRTGYVVTNSGGGTTVTIWSGPLHGYPIGPSISFAISTADASDAGSTGPPYNQLDVNFSHTGFPDGTTFDVTYRCDPSSSGSFGSSTGNTASPVTFSSVTFGGSPGTGTVTVAAQYQGVTLSFLTKPVTFTT